MEPVALVCGIRSEPPVALVLSALEERGLPHMLWHQRDFESQSFTLPMDSAAHSSSEGWIESNGVRHPLSSVAGIYTRVVDSDTLPDFSDRPVDDPDRLRTRDLQIRLCSWIESAPVRVLNRARSMASNASKPYQAQRIRAAGFRIPTTLVTNSADDVRAFVLRFKRVIVKGISGERTIVREYGDEHEATLDLLARCPAQFQAYVEGTDMRVHVVGRSVFATRVVSDATDYRYAGESTRLEGVRLDPVLEARCIELAHGLDLPLAGIDLRITPEGEAVCFEVNPSPAFSYYEGDTGQPISRAIAEYLVGIAA